MSPTASARDTPLTLTYELAELPSSQHRAGLAGLVLMCRWLANQAKPSQPYLCQIQEIDADHLVLRLDRAGLRVLFDEVYGANKIERPHRTRLSGKPPIREEPRIETDKKTGKSKKSTAYIYEHTEPKGAYLADWDDRGPWTKLWRDMLWNTIRGKPTTRTPFHKRAHGEPTSDADKLYKDLCRIDKAVDLPSTYFLGAQEKTAENVCFRDLARYQFLLHFWPFVASVYVPSVVENDGKRKYIGYAIAVPDVADLEEFCAELPEAMGERTSQLAGYIPAQARVDLALESALDLLSRLLSRLRLRGRHQLDLVQGVEVFHLEKKGNNIHLLGTARIDIEEAQIDHYIRIRNAYRDSHFRRQRLLNLVEHRRWYANFDRLFATTPWMQTITSREFRSDAKNAFTAHENTTNEANTMSEKDPNPDNLESLIYHVIGVYLGAKLDNKYQLKWKAIKESGDSKKKSEYNEKRLKLAKDAFLAIRSRTGSDFIDYFSGTLFSEPQRSLNEAAYAVLARALIEQPDKIRTLTLLALSAQS